MKGFCRRCGDREELVAGVCDHCDSDFEDVPAVHIEEHLDVRPVEPCQVCHEPAYGGWCRRCRTQLDEEIERWPR